MTERPALPNTVGLAGTMRDFMEWARSEFPEATTLGCHRHLEEEMLELGTEIMRRPKDPGGDEALELEAAAWRIRMENELADILALAYHVAMREDLDVVRGLRRKLQINKTRTWRRDGTREK